MLSIERVLWMRSSKIQVKCFFLKMYWKIGQTNQQILATLAMLISDLCLLVSNSMRPALWISLLFLHTKRQVGCKTPCPFKVITVLHFWSSNETTKNNSLIYFAQFAVFCLFVLQWKSKVFYSQFSLTSHSKKQKSLFMLWVYYQIEIARAITVII